MKGIILAGGSGTRLYPITKGFSKQLLPIYDKPMIYYPLSVLMLAGIRDILIITTSEDQVNFIRTLGDGSDFGVNLTYEIQPSPDGLAQALIIGEEFIGEDNVCLILGDNIFWGQDFTLLLKKAINRCNGATVFGYKVHDPDRFGIIEFNNDKKVLTIEEKPKYPKSNFAVTGLYFYDNQAIKMVKEVQPSIRGELEITSLNKMYLDKDDLHVELLGRGFAWFDTGTHESLLEASSFVEIIERQQGYKIACLEEVAWNNRWINKEQVLKTAESYSKNSYGKYLRELIKEER